MGLDVGPVAMGHIGGGARLSFDVVGDPVNTANKLQTVGKRLAPYDEASVFVTEAMQELVMRLQGDSPEGFRFVPCGPQPIEGRTSPMQIFRLLI